MSFKMRLYYFYFENVSILSKIVLPIVSRINLYHKVFHLLSQQAGLKNKNHLVIIKGIDILNQDIKVIHDVYHV